MSGRALGPQLGLGSATTSHENLREHAGRYCQKQPEEQFNGPSAGREGRQQDEEYKNPHDDPGDGRLHHLSLPRTAETRGRIAA